MKTTILFFCSLFIFSVSNSQDMVQHLVNSNWTVTSGSPSEIDLMDSELDSNQRTVTVGNTFEAGEGMNVIVSRFNSSGGLDWEVNWNSSGNQDDYGTALTIDASGNVFVCGATYDNSGDDYNFLLLKISSAGNVVFFKEYDGADGLNDVATDIALDNSGNTYLPASVQDAQSLYDYCTLKYNSLGTLIWDVGYDYSQYYDAAVQISVYSNYVFVTGGSGSSYDDWDICTIKYSSSSGAQIAAKRISGDAAGFDLPSDLGFDNSGNIFVTGKVTTLSQGTDIKTVKLDDDLDLLWSQTLDGNGLDDAGNSLYIDDTGGVTVAGTVSNSNGTSSGITATYSSSGSLVWSKIVPGSLNDQSQDARAITIYNGDYYVASVFTDTEGEHLYLTTYDSSGNLLWRYKSKANDDLHVSKMHIDSSGRIYITGMAENNAVREYYVSKYIHDKLDSYYDNSSNPSYFKEQLLVAFRPSALDSSFVYDKERVYGELNDILTPAAYQSLDNQTTFDLTKSIALKIHKRMTPLNQWSISRQGDTIAIPDFWTQMKITLESGVNEESIINELKQADDVVRHCQKNGIGELMGCETEEFYQVEDEDLAEYDWLQSSDVELDQQNSVAPFDSGISYNIDLDDSWCMSTGEEHIIVGVFDSAINYLHEDFQFQGETVIVGYDYIDSPQHPLDETSLENGDEHALRVAGIIGALRNNGKGLSGIAGGDYQHLEENDVLGDSLTAGDIQQGVTINNFRVGTGVIIMEEFLIEAFVEGATDDPLEDFGEAIHIMNNSIRIRVDTLEPYPWRLQPENTELMIAEAYKYAVKNGVIGVNARGNEGGTIEPEDLPVYPSSYYDDWGISVGASNLLNQRASFSNYGLDMDLLAPGVPQAVWSLENGTGNDGYYWFDGTSASAPHVSGTAALMLSYYNEPFPDPSNLAMADVESIIQMSCLNIGAPGPDDETGYGALKAGAAMDLLDSNNYLVLHEEYESVLPSSPSETNVQLKLLQEYEGIAADDYKVDVYEVTGTDTYSYPPDFVFNASWDRGVSGNTMRYYHSDGGINYLFPDEGANVVASSLGSTEVSGYVYHLVEDGQGDSVDLWIPDASNYIIPYTAHLKHEPVMNIESSISSGFLIYPNPANNHLNIEVSDEFIHYTLSIINDLGQTVFEKRNAKSIDLSYLSKGLYVVRITNDKSSIAEKLIIE